MEQATACLGLGRIRARNLKRQQPSALASATQPDDEEEAVEWFLQANPLFQESGSAISMRQLWMELQAVRPMSKEAAAIKIQARYRGASARK